MVKLNKHINCSRVPPLRERMRDSQTHFHIPYLFGAPQTVNMRVDIAHTIYTPPIYAYIYVIYLLLWAPYQSINWRQNL